MYDEAKIIVDKSKAEYSCTTLQHALVRDRHHVHCVERLIEIGEFLYPPASATAHTTVCFKVLCLKLSFYEIYRKCCPTNNLSTGNLQIVSVSPFVGHLPLRCLCLSIRRESRLPSHFRPLSPPTQEATRTSTRLSADRQKKMNPGREENGREQ